MAVNKVEVNGETVLDLTNDTVSEDSLLDGATAHNGAGNPIEGKVKLSSVSIEDNKDGGIDISVDGYKKTLASQESVSKLKDDLADKVPKKDYAPETKTESMTQPVGKDENGKLWTTSGSGGSGGSVSSVNGKTGAVVLTAEDVHALRDDTVIPTVPEKVSAFENDAGYLTEHQDISGKVDKVAGKGLSTHDYDNAAKAKVDAIPEDPKYTDTVYDDAEVKQGLNQLNGDIAALQGIANDDHINGLINTALGVIENGSY